MESVWCGVVSESVKRESSHLVFLFTVCWYINSLVELSKGIGLPFISAPPPVGQHQTILRTTQAKLLASKVLVVIYILLMWVTWHTLCMTIGNR